MKLPITPELAAALEALETIKSDTAKAHSVRAELVTALRAAEAASDAAQAAAFEAGADAMLAPDAASTKLAAKTQTALLIARAEVERLSGIGGVLASREATIAAQFTEAVVTVRAELNIAAGVLVEALSTRFAVATSEVRRLKMLGLALRNAGVGAVDPMFLKTEMPDPSTGVDGAYVRGSGAFDSEANELDQHLSEMLRALRLPDRQSAEQELANAAA